MSAKAVVLVAVGLAKIGSAAGRAFEDKNIGMDDLDDAFAALGGVQTLIKVDYKQAVADVQLAEGRAEAVAIFKEQFDIPADKIEAVLEDALDLGLDGFQVLVKAIALAAKIKDALAK